MKFNFIFLLVLLFLILACTLYTGAGANLENNFFTNILLNISKLGHKVEFWVILVLLFIVSYNIGKSLPIDNEVENKRERSYNKYNLEHTHKLEQTNKELKEENEKLKKRDSLKEKNLIQSNYCTPITPQQTERESLEQKPNNIIDTKYNLNNTRDSERIPKSIEETSIIRYLRPADENGYFFKEAKTPERNCWYKLELKAENEKTGLFTFIGNISELLSSNSVDNACEILSSEESQNISMSMKPGIAIFDYQENKWKVNKKTIITLS